MKQRTVEIFIETREKIIFRQTTAQEIERVCEACRTRTVFVAPERAISFAGLTAREIYRRIERGAIHFIETDTGATLVCAASLSNNPNELKQLDSSNKGERL